MKKVAAESYRVLKQGKFCTILMGDTRRKGHVIPLAFEVMKVFEGAGFHLKEIVIKEQHNCSATGYWKTNSVKYNFLLLAHEYLFVFKKDWKPFSGYVYEDFILPARDVSFSVECPKCCHNQIVKSDFGENQDAESVFYGAGTPYLKQYVSDSMYKTAMKKIGEGYRVNENIGFGFVPFYCPECRILEMRFMFVLEKDGCKPYAPKYKCDVCKKGLNRLSVEEDVGELFVRCEECGELIALPGNLGEM